MSDASETLDAIALALAGREMAGDEKTVAAIRGVIGLSLVVSAPLRTRTGRVLTDEDFDRLAAEAEEGYKFELLDGKETAVVIDALGIAREQIRGEGRETPNIDSALAKINRLMTPQTRGLTVMPRT